MPSKSFLSSMMNSELNPPSPFTKRLCFNVILRLQPKLVLSKSEGTLEILHGVYPEPMNETLRFAQGYKWRRVQNDRRRVQNDNGGFHDHDAPGPGACATARSRISDNRYPPSQSLSPAGESAPQPFHFPKTL